MLLCILGFKQKGEWPLPSVPLEPAGSLTASICFCFSIPHHLLLGECSQVGT